MTRRTESRGYSLIELMAAVALGLTLIAAALPEYLTSMDDARASGAARHLASRLQRARMEAVMRSAMVGVRFTQASDGRYTYAAYLDGNGNGILTRDIQRGVDLPITAPEALPDQFPGVEFGVIPGLPPVDSGGTAPGSDPIRLGAGSIASFSSSGTATSGTVYVRSRHDAQYAVRIFGETGRTRMLKFDSRSRQWRQL
jgi:prepilin-type N-terminal cleavage/methylation domain-containing protein